MNNEQSANETKLTDWIFTGNRPVLLMLSIVVAAAIWIIAVNNIPKQERCCLFDSYQPTFAEQNRILTALGATELTGYDVQLGSIQVPKEQKGKFLAAIAEKNAMPEALSLIHI